MKLLLSILTLALTPILAAAQTAPIARTVDGLLSYLIYLGGRIMPLLILAALVLFLFGVVKTFLWNSGAGREEGKGFILGGIIALFVMVSVWGLVNLLRNTLNLDNKDIPLAPAVPVQNAPEARPVPSI